MFNSLPKDKILDRSNLKALTDNKTNVIEKLKFILGTIENMVEKGENADYQHFLLYKQSMSECNTILSAYFVQALRIVLHSPTAMFSKCFFCMVLVYFHNVCYQCLKCQVDGFYSLEVMVRKKK